jgi:hypothetical protein
MVLGLAFAALVTPVAAQAQTGLMVDEGSAVKPVSVSSYQPAYLRYHQVGVPVASNTLTAETKRFLAMARATQNQPQQSAAVSENSAKTITPLQADGMRWTAMAKYYSQNQPSAAISERSNGVKGPDPSLVPQVVLSTSSGFDWSDAGIGASTVFGVALLLGIALFLTRRNQHSGLTNA